MSLAARVVAFGFTAAVLSATFPARAQWNEDLQREREERERTTRERELARQRLRDPEDPRIIVSKTTSLEIGALGLRGGAIESRNASTATGFALAIAGADYFDGTVNRRVRVEARVGESEGPEGSARADVALGYRFDLDPWYGLIVRGGVRGRIFGNDRLSVSALEVPQAQVGFQFFPTAIGAETKSPLGPVALFEIAGRASAGLVAQAEVDTLARHVKPTPAFGGHLALTVGRVVLNVEYTHFLPNGASSVPIDDAVASICAVGDVLSICANGEATWTAVLGPVNDQRRERIMMYGATLSVPLRELIPGSSL